MRILLDNNVPRLLTSNLPDHQADTAFQCDWHTRVRQKIVLVTFDTPANRSPTWSAVGSDSPSWAHRLRMSPKC